MDFYAAWQKFAFLLVHVANFELQLALWANALAAWRLATVLDRHSLRLKEAKLSRRVATVCVLVSGILFLVDMLLS